MSTDRSSWIFPNAPTPIEHLELLEQHQAAYDFRREVEYRAEWQQYCQWYRETAQQHQQELAAMQNDINLFGWVCARSSSSYRNRQRR